MAQWGSLILGRGLLVSCLLAAPGAAGQQAGGAQRLAFLSDREGAQGFLRPRRDPPGPAWSRDGTRIAVLVSASPDVHARQYQIETIDPAGGDRRRLTARPGHYRSLTWSP